MYMQHRKSIPETNEIVYLHWLSKNWLGMMEGVKGVGENRGSANSLTIPFCIVLECELC